MDYKQNILDMAEQVQQWSLVELSEIPKIPLYMEQVTSFFDEMLSGARRSEDDKILTKTMINNYTKEGTLPRPNGKKYSREHMIKLVYIFLLKQVHALQDVGHILALMDSHDAEPLYSAYLELAQDSKQRYRAQLEQTMGDIAAKLEEKGLDTRENFELLAMLLTVTDAITGKMLVWRLLDQHAEECRSKAANEKEKK